MTDYKAITFPMIIADRMVYETILIDESGKPSPTTPPETLKAYNWIRRSVHPLYRDPCDWDKWLESKLPAKKHDPLKVGNRPNDRSWNADNEISNADTPSFLEKEFDRCIPDTL